MKNIVIEVEDGVVVNVHDKHGEIEYSVLDWDTEEILGILEMLRHMGITDLDRLLYYEEKLDQNEDDVELIIDEAIQEVLND